MSDGHSDEIHVMAYGIEEDGRTKIELEILDPEEVDGRMDELMADPENIEPGKNHFRDDIVGGVIGKNIKYPEDFK